MTTKTQMHWTILPAPAALQRMREARLDTHAIDDWQPGPIALLQPAGDSHRILAARPADTPELADALLAEAGPGSAGALAAAIADAAGDWWRTAHVWTAFCRWHPGGTTDWRSHLEPCPAPETDGLAELLGPTRGWLLWDFQWMAVLVACGVEWDLADAMRRGWNLGRPGTNATLAAWRINDRPLDQVVLARTLGPTHITSRVDSWAVQRLAKWARDDAAANRSRECAASRSIGFTLTEHEARLVQEWAGPIAAAMQDKAIEFPGIEFVLGVGSFGETLEARIGSMYLSLR
jgi:hypothetical protein